MKMQFYPPQHWVLSSALVVLLVLLGTPLSHALRNTQNNIKEAVFFSPKFELKPGSVSNKYYYDIEFPRGHVAIKSFTGEVIDEEGNSIPLYETYLHHWLVFRYHQRKGATHTGHGIPPKSDYAIVRNSGLCHQKDFILSQYFGIGSETRKTTTYIPDPFGIEIVNPAEIPDGYEEKWLLNVHAIDTRGVQDKKGCIECRCDHYNVTKDEYGKPLKAGYLGGLYCCYDKTQCRVKEGFEAPKRSLYLKYTVKWIDSDDLIVPVKVYILDVTDRLKKLNGSKGMRVKHNCQLEYQVEPCSNNNKDNSGCIDVRRKSLPMPNGGYVIYGVTHQHSYGLGSTLYAQDGRVICSSKPRYGRGKEAGNEAGYVVGMSTCYPKPGSVQIFDGETLTIESNYSNSERHTGLMGLFYLLRLIAHAYGHLNSGVKNSNQVSQIELLASISALVLPQLRHENSIKMRFVSQYWLLSSATVLLLLLGTPLSHALWKNENNVKEAVFLSPKFELGPGSVLDQYYFDIEFPRGHVAIKSFTGEVIDEEGNSIPLHETYLHHWLVFRYHQRKGVTHTGYGGHQVLSESDLVIVSNSGLCQNLISQYFGIGSETRRTATDIPDPYGIEIGNPAEIADGYEEKWMLNVHAIDTRGVEDRMGCTECRCDLYNVTMDQFGHPLRSDYRGGLLCCHDNTQCKVREGFEGPKRSLFIRYTVKWIEWDNSIVPVKIYILDVTDKLQVSNGSKATPTKDNCQIEYDVEPCSNDKDSSGCIDVKRTSLPMPSGGYVIYGVAHQHSGGVGSTLYGQDGRIICSSKPIYGSGKEAGNEAGYIVGMSTCYPKPGSVQISDGETVTLESNYSSSQRHTGLMGLFYLLVAEKLSDQHSMHFSRASLVAEMI
ncbi:stress up-regulated Nod 19 protein [Senna tora]|uniref:Stress up-regulated Nod 19 protein n=1 Tax=Senna tora TaxID=362788 RepID=A0A834SH16_9FABA|nr:stress up-regulated Nod 19 protein [Senna tora]